MLDLVKVVDVLVDVGALHELIVAGQLNGTQIGVGEQ